NVALVRTKPAGPTVARFASWPTTMTARSGQKPRPPAGREGDEQEHGIELQHSREAEPRPGATVAAGGGAPPAEQRERQDEELELADVEEAPERRPCREGEARSRGEPQPATNGRQQHEVEPQPERHDHRKGSSVSGTLKSASAGGCGAG